MGVISDHIDFKYVCRLMAQIWLLLHYPIKLFHWNFHFHLKASFCGCYSSYVQKGITVKNLRQLVDFVKVIITISVKIFVQILRLQWYDLISSTIAVPNLKIPNISAINFTIFRQYFIAISPDYVTNTLGRICLPAPARLPGLRGLNLVQCIPISLVSR
jgi:hypothetical protein